MNNSSYTSTVSLIGRVLLAAMFITAGFGKLTNIAGTAGYIASHGMPMPMPSVMAVLAGLLEFFGGLALVLGFKVRWVGLAMALFTVAATFIFHAFWAAPEAQQMVVKQLFNKNISVIGGLLLISALGAGPWSLDARSRQH